MLSRQIYFAFTSNEQTKVEEEEEEEEEQKKTIN